MLLAYTQAITGDLHVLLLHQWDIVSNLVKTLTPVEEVTLHNSSASYIIPWEGIHEKDRNPKRQQTPCRRCIDEMFSSLLEPQDDLHLSLKEPMIYRRKGDPIQWWRQNKGRFRLLATEARKFLRSPPIISKHAFSEMYKKKRSHLTGEQAEQLLFLHHNLVILN